MQTIHFTAAQLKAIALLAAQQDVRYYLNGVLVEATQFETRIVATDGHKMGVVRHAVENDIDTDVSLIVPTSVIGLLKASKSDGNKIVNIEIDNDVHTLCAPFTGLRAGFTPVEGRFPDYRRVVPAKPSGEFAHFMPQLLMEFVKCGQLLTGKAIVVPRLEHNGKSSGRVTFDGFDNFIGVVMPYDFKKDAKPADTTWI